MRHRHRRRARRRHAVDLGGVAVDDLGLVAAQPDAAHREAGEALGLGDAGLLQQRDRGAAGAEEDGAGVEGAPCAGGLVRDLEAPAAGGQAMQAGHLLGEVHGEAVLLAQVVEQVAGQRAVVHVGAVDDTRRRDRLRGIAALHQQRRPLGICCVVLGIFHAVIAGMRAHRGVPLPEERLAIGADARSSCAARDG